MDLLWAILGLASSIGFPSPAGDGGEVKAMIVDSLRALEFKSERPEVGLEVAFDLSEDVLWREEPEGPGDATDAIGCQLLCETVATGLDTALTGSFFC